MTTDELFLQNIQYSCEKIIKSRERILSGVGNVESTQIDKLIINLIQQIVTHLGYGDKAEVAASIAGYCAWLFMQNANSMLDGELEYEKILNSLIAEIYQRATQVNTGIACYVKHLQWLQRRRRNGDDIHNYKE